jgi:methyl-accepting chemotaxis protein
LQSSYRTLGPTELDGMRMPRWCDRLASAARRLSLSVSRRIQLRTRLALGVAVAAIPLIVVLLQLLTSTVRSAADLRMLKHAAFIALGLSIVFAIIAVRWLASAVIRPVRQAVAVLNQAAAGNFRPRLVGTKRADEVGEMARSLNRMLDNAADMFFAVDSGVHVLERSSTRLRGAAGHLAGSANNASDQSMFVSYAADQVSQSVVSAAAGSEQMEMAIRDIAENASRAAGIAAEAAHTAIRANGTVAKLGESSTEIGNVLKVITSIARQTHLLALNATIEAAHAGDAGAGFAVVASEVRDLSNATARATDDIAQMIAAIQSDSAEAVAMIHDIGLVVERINDFQSTISAAVEEQTASTNEMTRAIAQAAGASGEIAERIVSVAAEALSTASGVGEAREVSIAVHHTADELASVVGRLRY